MYDSLSAIFVDGNSQPKDDTFFFFYLEDEEQSPGNVEGDSRLDSHRHASSVPVEAVSFSPMAIETPNDAGMSKQHRET